MRNEIGALMYSIMDLLDPCLVLKQSTEELKSLFGGECNVLIYLYDEENKMFTVGCDAATIEIPQGLGLFYDAFKYKKELTDDSSIYVPLTCNRLDTIGVIQIIRDKKLTKKEKSILKEASKAIASVYRNAAIHLSMKDTFESFIDTLSSAIDARDFVTSGHSKRTALYASELCHLLGLHPVVCERIKYAALLHDIGKIGISEKLLQKSGGLDETQFIEVKRHAVIGKQILDNTKLPKEFAEIPAIVESHHERWDGSGYPRGLKQKEIPLESRILAICDVFDALTSHRQYRNEMDFEEALQLMSNEKGQFDPEILPTFLTIPLENLRKIHLSHRI
jgi:putative nucleotidyltransferase with HDIG domain